MTCKGTCRTHDDVIFHKKFHPVFSLGNGYPKCRQCEIIFTRFTSLTRCPCCNAPLAKTAKNSIHKPITVRM